MIITCLKFLKLSPWTSLSIFDIFRWLCLFPMTQWTHKWIPQIENISKKSKISPKSEKINICWFLQKIHRQSFKYTHKVSSHWFISSNFNFWSFYDVLKWDNELEFLNFHVFCTNYIHLYFIFRLWDILCDDIDLNWFSHIIESPTKIIEGFVSYIVSFIP